MPIETNVEMDTWEKIIVAHAVGDQISTDCYKALVSRVIQEGYKSGEEFVTAMDLPEANVKEEYGITNLDEVPGWNSNKSTIKGALDAGVVLTDETGKIKAKGQIAKETKAAKYDPAAHGGVSFEVAEKMTRYIKALDKAEKAARELGYTGDADILKGLSRQY